MLVLSRKTNESIVIGGDIEIKISEIKGNHVRVGITAPRYVSVWRKELICSDEVTVQKRMVLQKV